MKNIYWNVLFAFLFFQWAFVFINYESILFPFVKGFVIPNLDSVAQERIAWVSFSILFGQLVFFSASKASEALVWALAQVVVFIIVFFSDIWSPLRFYIFLMALLSLRHRVYYLSLGSHNESVAVLSRTMGRGLFERFQNYSAVFAFSAIFAIGFAVSIMPAREMVDWATIAFLALLVIFSFRMVSLFGLAEGQAKYETSRFVDNWRDSRLFRFWVSIGAKRSFEIVFLAHLSVFIIISRDFNYGIALFLLMIPMFQWIVLALFRNDQRDCLAIVNRLCTDKVEWLPILSPPPAHITAFGLISFNTDAMSAVMQIISINDKEEGVDN